MEIVLFIFSSLHQKKTLFFLYGARYGTWACTVPFLFWLLLTLHLFFSPLLQNTHTKLLYTSSSKIKDWSCLHTGTLSLQRLTKEDPFMGLRQEICLIAKNPLPTNSNKNGDFVLLLRSSHSERAFHRKERIFLSCDALPGGVAPSYHFCDHKTPLWIQIDFSPKGSALLEAGLFTLNKEKALFEEEKVSWELEIDPRLYTEQKAPPFVEALQSTKVWGQDVVIEKLGMEKFPSLVGKIKLEICCQGKRNFCFVRKGDVLCYDHRGWVPISLSEILEDRPIAQVKKASAKSVELEVWDPMALRNFTVQIDSAPALWQTVKPDLLPHSFSIKNSKQASCFFGKRRYVLKEGDWLIKTKRGWRHLRHSADRMQYIQHALLGELFIFESLTKDCGKWMIKGILVDEMRTQTQPFSCAVAVESSVSKHSQHKPTRPSYKSETLPTTYLSPATNFHEDEQEDD